MVENQLGAKSYFRYKLGLFTILFTCLCVERIAYTIINQTEEQVKDSKNLAASVQNEDDD